MTPYKKLLSENKAWANEKTKDDPEYFDRLAHFENCQTVNYL